MNPIALYPSVNKIIANDNFYMMNFCLGKGGWGGGVSLACVKLWHMHAIILADIRCVCEGGECVRVHKLVYVGRSAKKSCILFSSLAANSINVAAKCSRVCGLCQSVCGLRVNAIDLCDIRTVVEPDKKCSTHTRLNDSEWGTRARPRERATLVYLAARCTAVLRFSGYV